MFVYICSSFYLIGKLEKDFVKNTKLKLMLEID